MKLILDCAGIKPAVAPLQSTRGSLCRCHAKVTFSVPKKVPYGHSVGLVGSLEPVGTWDTTKALQLGWCNDDVWSAEVDFPTGQSIEYKFFVRGADGAIEGWQPGNNLVLDVPAEDAVLQVTDDWEGKDRRILRSWADPSKDTPSPLQSQSSPEAPFTPESQPAASATAPEPSTSGGETFFGEASAVATKPPALETHEESIPAGPGAGDPDLSGVQSNGSANGSALAAGTAALTEEQLKKMTVKELKGLLKERDIKIPKLKAEMVSALLNM